LFHLERITSFKKRGTLGAALDVFRIVPFKKRVIVVIGLTLSSIFELIGLTMIVPLMAAISFNPEGAEGTQAPHLGGFKAVVSQTFHHLLEITGLQPNIGIFIVIIATILALKSAISIAVMRYVGDMMANMTTFVRMAIIRNLLNADWAYFVRQPLGRLVRSTSAETNAVGESFLCVANLLSSALQSCGYAIVAVLISWRLSIIAFAIALVMFGTFGKLIQATKRASRAQSQQLRNMATSFTDTLLGMKPIKAMGRQARFTALYEEDARRLHEAMRSKVISSEFASELQEPIIASLLCLGLYIATVLWKIQLHEQIIVGLLLLRLIGSFSQIQRAYQRFVSSRDMYKSVGKLLAQSAKARETLPGVIKPTLERHIKFTNLTFAYNATAIILDKVNWTLTAGRVTALIGPSGVGKSTIVDLILGLRRPQSGAVRLDDVALDTIDMAAWRHMIGYVPQEISLFKGSIFNNVTLGDAEFTEADVVAALRAAGAYSFVERLPNGIYEMVGERGHRLSGGQRQRIAIARALVRNPKLLILDEATTGLDKETERDICTCVRQLARERGITVLSVSHQPAWAEIADDVVKIENGTMIAATAEKTRI